MSKAELLQEIVDAKLTKGETKELISFIKQMIGLEISMSNDGHPSYR
jgi:hypothetical protein